MNDQWAYLARGRYSARLELITENSSSLHFSLLTSPFSNVQEPPSSSEQFNRFYFLFYEHGSLRFYILPGMESIAGWG